MKILPMPDAHARSGTRIFNSCTALNTIAPESEVRA
ncbi:hypothetical protein SAMN05892877_11158 [Rhizobium subbaraonis]|uniref:Uncharacterized protein n=1 Tax=Rhizobium subbaraonis TaxID=908946 RepID=A0A285URR2_9HYPH|nr:hypothetical protein SAMN05892877_11158 [Rhizobium subbaraonis]